MELGLSLGLGFTAAVNERLGRQEDGQEPEKSHRSNDSDEDDDVDVEDYDHATSSSEEPHRSADQRLAIFVPPVPLDLLPPAPVQNKNVAAARATPSPAAEEVSSPNSVASSFRAIDFSIFKRNRNGAAVDDGRASDAAANGGASEPASRGSDEDENGVNARKKLRLSKEQSAYLEESFKEHHTLNPKQKHALAKQLNLRPRQVEVWFQNRRARTKLKQTEVDCEYLKRCCETLREENRRLHKELQELRALKSSNPFYMHLPATTLTMCPSCEKVASTSTAAAAAPAAAAAAAVSAPTTPTTAAAPDSIPKPIPFLAKPRFFPFTAAHNPGHPHQSAAS